MKSRTIVTALFCVIGLTSSAQEVFKVTLSGTLKNFDNQVEVEDMSALSALTLSKSDRFILPDSLGHFSITFNISGPNYFRVGRNILYLTPGDDLHLDIDRKDPAKGKFKGSHSQENQYLINTPFPKGGSFLDGGRNLKPTLQQTVDTLIQIAKQKELDLNKLNLSPEFKDLEIARIKADLIRSFTQSRFYYQLKHKIKTRDSLKMVEDDYQKTVLPYVNKYSTDFVNPAYLDLVVYRDDLDHVLENFKGNTKDLLKLIDFNDAENLYRKIVRLKDKNKIRSYLPQIDSIKDFHYRAALKKTYNDLLGFGKGDMAEDFVATDMQGKQVSLSSLKGKVIMIDFWATWCGPCLAEMKYVDQLKEKYKNDPNFVLLSLSIDEDAVAWKANVKKRQADGLQLVLSANKMLPYAIKGIPRTVFIDKNFKVAEMQGPLPSDKNITIYIDELLK